MIIPTPEFDSRFADDGVPFRTKMIQYIEQEFGDILANRRQLLQSDGGLKVLSNFIRGQIQSDRSIKAA